MKSYPRRDPVTEMIVFAETPDETTPDARESLILIAAALDPEKATAEHREMFIGAPTLEPEFVPEKCGVVHFLNERVYRYTGEYSLGTDLRGAALMSAVQPSDDALLARDIADMIKKDQQKDEVFRQAFIEQYRAGMRLLELYLEDNKPDILAITRDIARGD